MKEPREGADRGRVLEDVLLVFLLCFGQVLRGRRLAVDEAVAIVLLRSSLIRGRALGLRGSWPRCGIRRSTLRKGRRQPNGEQQACGQRMIPMAVSPGARFGTRLGCPVHGPQKQKRHSHQ